MLPLARYAPGLAALLRYRLDDAPADLRAGLAVAAVALPVGIAYAELAGFRPEVGLYSSILPLVAYAIFGSSRQLIVGPDAATCALVAASVAPLAAGDQATYASLSVMLALLTGVLCIAASFLRLGALADFLSRPILVGFLNGVALSIIIGQAGKIFGFPVEESGIVPRLIEIAGKLGEIHGPTFVVALGTFAVIAIVPPLVPQLPAALVAMVLAGAAGYVLAWLTIGSLHAWVFSVLADTGISVSPVAIDWRALTFAIGLGVATIVLFGLLPALSASRTVLTRALAQSTRTTRATARLRGGLVTIQLALALTLLAGAGVLVRTLHGLRTMDFGLQPEGVVVFMRVR